MKRYSFLVVALLLLLGVFTFAQISSAETGKLVLQVQNVQDHPVKGVEIGIKGRGGSGTSGSDGKIELTLPEATGEGQSVEIHLASSPSGKSLDILSPWNPRIIVPPFSNRSENFIEVVVVEHSDKVSLLSGKGLRLLTAKINNAIASNPPTREDPNSALNAVAKQYGLTADELDQRVRAWGATTIDPYEAGLAALYERNYPKALSQFQASLKLREQRLMGDERTRETDRKAVAIAASQLSSTLVEQGEYKKASALLNHLALMFYRQNDSAGGVPYIVRAIDVDRQALGPAGLQREPEDPSFARDLNLLAMLLEAGKSFRPWAEVLYRRALAIDEKSLGPQAPEVATILFNLAGLLRDTGDFAGASQFAFAARTIDRKTQAVVNSANLSLDDPLEAAMTRKER